MVNWYAFGAVLLLMALVIAGWFALGRRAERWKQTRGRGPRDSA